MRDLADHSGDSGEQGAVPELLPLDMRDVTYAYRGRQLVGSIDLHVETPGITMVLGPNGAGKSLFLRLLHGLVEPSSGRIRWGGVPMTRAITARQALVFQKPVLLRRSVAANLDFVLRARKRACAGRRDALLAQVGLVGKASQAARLLSGGEQQRLALARALALEPDILLLDEPTASLDPASTQAIEAFVSDVAARGTKVLFVTHDIGQARRLADDVVFLSGGRVAEHAAAARFFEAPESAAASAYLAGHLVY